MDQISHNYDFLLVFHCTCVCCALFISKKLKCPWNTPLWKYSVVPRLKFAIIYHYIKFEMPSFVRVKDITGPKMGHVTLITLLLTQFVML